MSITDVDPAPVRGDAANRALAVELTGVTKTFRTRGRDARTVEAVRGIDLTIRTGEIVALLGPNGAGKTTTLDMILGFVRPTSGRVAVLRGSPAEAITAGRVSSVMQTGGLLPHLTVGETLRLVASTFARTDDLDAVSQRAGIEGILGRRVNVCSGGEQQRLRFALALLPDPDLLVLDEPTAGLDVASRRAFWEAIRADATHNRTVVFATHYLAEADEEAQRVVLVKDGRIVADGAVSEVKAAALGRRVRAACDARFDAGLHDHPAVTELTRVGQVVALRTTDSDALARHLFAHTDAADVEITSEALDEAFVALTSDPVPSATLEGTSR